MYGITGLPTDPRISGGLPTTLITGYADLGRQATNPQWQYPTMWNPKINYTWVTGKHSLKTGYEYQHISTEVQDVNPLYGRDTYSGQITRPTGASSNNLYNLADFIFGYRSQYALSNILIANLRQQMHFTYLQDDWRVNNNLTLNVGLRYEYATPHYEEDNILSNYDPVAKKMIMAKDGSLYDRALVNPDRNNFAPRLGLRLHADAEDRRPRRLRDQLHPLPPRRRGEPAVDQRPAGHQRGRQPDEPDAVHLPHDAGRLPGRPHRSLHVQPGAGQHHLHADATTTRARCRATTSRCSARSRRT